MTCAWYASAEPSGERAWDERYSLRNVESILRTGSLRPVLSWYPSLSHLPQTAVLAASRALHRATGYEAFDVFLPSGGLGPTAYLLCRWVNVLYAAGCLLLTFALGRRLFSSEVGLLAALVLAGAPWFVRAAGIFKPDPLLVLLTLATFWWSLDAAAKGSLGSYLLAGVGVGLTASSKQNGALASIPLAIATLLHYRSRSRWLWLVAAGLASITVWAALNPFPDLLHGYMRAGVRFAQWAESANPRSHVLVFAPLLPLHGTWLGPVLGAAALAGYVGLAVRLVRRLDDASARVPLAMFLGFPLLYPLTFAAFSPFPKINFFLPVLPLAAIAAAWLVRSVWTEIAELCSRRTRRAVFWPAMAALVALALGPGIRTTYEGAVPDTTLSTAASLIASRAPFLSQRTAVFEEGEGEFEHRTGWGRGDEAFLVALDYPALSDLPGAGLDLVDYEVFPERQLHGPHSAFYLDRMLRLEPGEVWMVEPAPLRRRGERQVVLAHPWSPRGPALELVRPRRPQSERRSLGGRLPRELAPAEVVSLNVVLERRRARRCRLRVGPTPLELYTYRWGRRHVEMLTRRFTVKSRAPAVRLRCSGKEQLEGAEVTIWRWSARP